MILNNKQKNEIIKRKGMKRKKTLNALLNLSSLKSSFSPPFGAFVAAVTASSRRSGWYCCESDLTSSRTETSPL